MASGQPYSSRPTAAQQPYEDNYQDGPEFDPYYSRRPAYDQAGYLDRDNEFNFPDSARTANSGKLTKEGDALGYSSTPLSGRRESVGAWRKDFNGGLWTKGGRGRCIGRFCCCSIMTVVFLLVSVLLTLALYIRPPNVAFNNIGFPTTGSTVQATTDSLNLNLVANITVDNPNFFAVSFKDIKATLTYPINNTNVGGGEKDNVVFHAKTTETLSFPFTLSYKLADDPNKAVLNDLLTKCGITGSGSSDLSVNLKLTLGIRVLFVVISPSFSTNVNVPCDLNTDEIEALLNGAGITIPGLSS